MRRAEKKDHLIKIAMQLFNKHGYHATGVDRIMEETGIAKTTLYRHFETKEDLIVAALARVDEETRAEMRDYVEQASTDPRARILASFDLLDRWLKDGEFKGCPFIAAAAEFGEKTHAVFQQARHHKKLYLAFFEELVRAAGYPNAKALALQIVILHEGAIACAQVLGPTGIAANAKAAAQRLLPAK